MSRNQPPKPRANTTRIDPELCNGCELCVKDCPADALEMKDGVAISTGEFSLGCDHCVAICPVDAVTVGFVDDDATRLETLEVSDKWVKYGKGGTEELVQLMRSRRSCRAFEPEPMDEAVLQDLVRIGMSAPSASNSQGWCFTILADRASVEDVGEGIAAWLADLNKKARSTVPRLVSRFFMKGDPLGFWAATYLERIEERLRRREATGEDQLFHEAPAVIVISNKPGASDPAADAMLAAQNILLAAHTMGYGTCLIGFATAAMNRDKTIQQRVGIPGREKVGAVIAVGRTRRRYKKTTRRGPAPVRVVKNSRLT